jgi:hypothetical protein
MKERVKQLGGEVNNEWLVATRTRREVVDVKGIVTDTLTGSLHDRQQSKFAPCGPLG